MAEPSESEFHTVVFHTVVFGELIGEFVRQQEFWAQIFGLVFRREQSVSWAETSQCWKSC